MCQNRRSGNQHPHAPRSKTGSNQPKPFLNLCTKMRFVLSSVLFPSVLGHRQPDSYAVSSVAGCATPPPTPGPIPFCHMLFSQLRQNLIIPWPPKIFLFSWAVLENFGGWNGRSGNKYVRPSQDCLNGPSSLKLSPKLLLVYAFYGVEVSFWAPIRRVLGIPCMIKIIGFSMEKEKRPDYRLIGISHTLHPFHFDIYVTKSLTC